MTRTVDSESILSIVIPLYNEEGTVETLVEEAGESLRELGFPGRHEIVLVNDGSSDQTGERVEEMASRDPERIIGIHLARNFGHASAASAGLDYAKGDAVILMDGDMQDDPAAFRPFVEKWEEGYDVVYAVRSARQESGPRRLLFWLFYKFIGMTADVRVPFQAGNFALMDRCVVDGLRSIPERNRYLPGLRAWVGFRQIGVPVPRRARYDKSSRVGLRGLWKLAMNAVFSFSYVPLFVFRVLGLLAMIVSIALMLFALYHKVVSGLAVEAWTSQLVAISFFGGVNLFGLGVTGEYIARIYDEVKGRPIYVIARTTRDRKAT